MRKYITEYLNQLNKNKTLTKDQLQDLLIKINFFQHERLIHLIVTISFAFFALIFLILGMVSYYFLIIFAILLVFVVLYIYHYYFLENSVQYLYKLYDLKKGK